MAMDTAVERKCDYALGGLIEEISLKNFMCHSELSINQLSNNKITFVTGPNGAGKSAILTSLMLGFGGRANITCRGQTTKGFVKEGKSFADILIKLRNDTSFGSFQREKFGKFIYIRRRLHPGGSSEYLISDEHLQPIYKTAAQLKKVLSYFDIRVENPLLLLTQENAKKLLFDASEKDMYKFFHAGTGLDNIHLRMVNLKKESERVRQNWVVRRDVFEKRKKDFAALERRYQRYRQVEDLQNRERELTQSLQWVDLAQKERDLATIREQADRLDKQRADLERKKEDAHRCIEEIQARVAEQAEAVKAAAAEVENTKGDVQSAQARQKEALTDLKKVEGEMQFRQKKLAQLNAQKNDVVRAIEAAQKQLRAKQGADAERQRNEARLVDLRRQKAELENSTEAAGRDDAMRRVAELRQNEQRLRSEEFALRRDLEQLSKQRAGYESVQTNSISRFGRMMPVILREIDDAVRRGVFKRAPIGPLGRYVSLKGDESWAPAVESAIGRNFSTFVVSGNPDKNALHDILRNKLRLSPASNDYPKVVSSDRPLGTGRIDVSRSRALCSDSSLLSFFDLAEVSDDDACNFLLELSSVEAKLFAEDGHAALKLVHEEKCQRTSEIIAKNLDRVVVQFHAKGAANFYSNNYPIRTNYLMKNVEHQMADVRRQESETNTRFQQLKPQLEAAVRELAAADAVLRRIDAAASRLNQNLRTIDIDIERISRLNANVLEEPNDEMLLEEDLQRKVAEIEAFQTNQEATILDARLKAANEQRKAADKLFEAARSVQAKAEAALERAEDQAGQIHRSVADARRKLPSLRDQYEKIAEQCNAQKAKVDASTASCQELLNSLLEKYGNRPRTRSNETRRDIEEALNELREKIADRERIDRTDFESIPDRMKSIKNEEKELCEKDTQLQSLETIINRRVEFFPRMIGATARHIESWFSKMSFTKDLNSQLKFDHQNGTLAFRVSSMPVNSSSQGKQRRVSSSQSMEMSQASRPETPSANATTRSIRTLSGGERSMSTVFFLLSLWENSGCPLKGMDEFDVFLDGENRERAISLIVKFSQTMCGQFFLLSPCNVSTLGGPSSRNQVIVLRKGGGLQGQELTQNSVSSPAPTRQSRKHRLSQLPQSQSQPQLSQSQQPSQAESDVGDSQAVDNHPHKIRRCKMEPDSDEDSD